MPEVGATEQRVPAIAFPKSDRLAAPVAGDAYGDRAVASLMSPAFKVKRECELRTDIRAR
jgi:hypothetical protein